MKLTIELVPQSSWGNNLRTLLTEFQWDTLRRQTYLAASYHCQICGSFGRLECHEKWDYNDVSRTQTLVGLIALCPLCHQVKHLGHTELLARQGRLDWDEVMRHALGVNECTESEFRKYLSLAFQTWTARSCYDWTVVVKKSLLP